ncbi:MAG: site-specific DNA-methyltransferase [Acidobacteria bacterium]|nr:site-specific DNA-methyltransferase [Acidobacteriota bacterium]
MSQKYEKLKTLLKELFQLDQPDLDFGLYRIMHAKSAEVTQFLDKDLLPQVKQEFGLYKTADKAVLEADLAKAMEQAHALGADPETLPKVKDLRHRIATEAVDLDGLESEVYDSLFNFFRRYYSEGDFLAKRVYKPGVYAVPYEGEEVTLHWANADQYYIKTTEHLRDYAFRLRPDSASNPLRVHFRLIDGTEGEHGNVKAVEGKDRLFVPVREGAAAPLISIDDGDLVIRFEYRPSTLTDWQPEAHEDKTKPPTQKDLLSLATKRVLASTDVTLTPWIEELAKPHLLSDGERAGYTRLEAHLQRYAARNTFDYFVHKDLGGFLRRELDFYIKNEVMHLDDVENESAPRVEQYLSKIRVIRRIASKLIDFLAQLEDFQDRLWRKKKFITDTSWLIRLDCIPDAFYAVIGANDAQRQEWIDLYAIDKIAGDLTTPAYTNPLTPAFLKANPTLLIDTVHFPPEVVFDLLQTFDTLEAEIGGVLLQGENFHALSLLQAAYDSAIDSIYIDPPYNTDAGPIIYKNGYRHSSWLSLVDGRIQLSRRLMTAEAIMCVTIDDVEVHHLRSLLESTLPTHKLLGAVAIKNNPAGRTGTVGFSICHEYALFYGREGAARVGRLEHSEVQKARYKEKDDVGAFEWTNFRKHGGLNTYRTARPRQFYPIYVEGDNIRIPAMEWDRNARVWKVQDEAAKGEEVLLPIDSDGRERIWDFVVDTAREAIPHLKVRKDTHGKTAIYRKWRLKDDGLLPQTIWDKSEYSAAEYGTNLLANIFGETHRFTFPKSLHAVEDCLRVANLKTNTEGVVLDYFAGSGTTGHAAIELNREDGGTRKFLLIEQADYFDTALVPRLKKIIYAPDWKDGAPRRFATAEEAERSPRIIKVLRLESYEDTLNNLVMDRTKAQQSLLDAPAARDSLREQFIIRYMLNVESRGSQSLLNVAAFKDPTAYRLKVRRPGSDESREINVDLLETFNWLTGLVVQHIAAPQAFSASFERDAEKRLQLTGRLKPAEGPFWFRTVTGTTPDGRKTLVIWRKLTGMAEEDNLVLDEWFTKQGYSSKDSEFDLIYVNGGNNLENLKAADDTWKVRLIEEDFHRLMFDTDGL